MVLWLLSQTNEEIFAHFLLLSNFLEEHLPSNRSTRRIGEKQESKNNCSIQNSHAIWNI